MPWLAALIDLARRNSCEPDFRAFGTPDRAVAIPHGDRRAGEGHACGDDLRKDQEAAHAYDNSMRVTCRGCANEMSLVIANLAGVLPNARARRNQRIRAREVAHQPFFEALAFLRR
jgi:hypothetical protein